MEPDKEIDWLAKIDSYTAGYRNTNAKIDSILARENIKPVLSRQVARDLSPKAREVAESNSRFLPRKNGAETVNSTFPKK